MAGRNRRLPGREKKPSKPRLQFAEPVGTGNTRVEMIQTEEADDRLQEFPDILRHRLEDHLHSDSTTHVDFTAGGASTFRLHSFADGHPARFVVPGTTEALDAAVYRYGMRKKHRSIIVVQSKPESEVEFNNGDPAIISYFGKGKKGQSTSRYAIWGPDGYRRDLFVDRIRYPPSVMSATPIMTTEEENNRSSPPAPTRYVGPASLQHLYPSDESDVPDQADESLFIPDANDAYLSDSESNWKVSIKQKNGTSSAKKSDEGHNFSASNFGSSSTTASPSPHKLPRSRYNSHKRPRSLAFTTGDDCDDDDAQYRNKIQRVEDSLLTPVSANFPSTARAELPKEVMLRFKGSLADKSWHLSKDLRQCNDVHKIFAYARVAKISDHTHAMLSASFAGGEMVEIVRDDEQTFKEFVTAIQEKSGNGRKMVEIVITPAQY